MHTMRDTQSFIITLVLASIVLLVLLPNGKPRPRVDGYLAREKRFEVYLFMHGYMCGVHKVNHYSGVGFCSALTAYRREIDPNASENLADYPELMAYKNVVLENKNFPYWMDPQDTWSRILILRSILKNK